MMARIKTTSILLLLLQPLQGSSCFKKQNNTLVFYQNIGELSDAEKYAETLTDDLKNKITSIQSKVLSSTSSASLQATGSESIGNTPNEKEANKDAEQVGDRIKFILIDLYRIFYTLHESSQIHPRTTLEKYSFKFMRNMLLCSRTFPFPIKEEQALYDVVKKYYRIPLDAYINSDNGDFSLVEQSVNIGRKKVYEALIALLKNKEYIKREYLG